MKMKMFRTLAIIFFVILVFSTSSIVSAVDYDVNGSNFQNVQNIVDITSSGDRILLGSNTYSGSGSTITVTGNKNITIQGQSNINRATLNANNLHGILNIAEGSSATIRYVNFVNGGSDGRALTARGTILIEYCNFTNSRGDSGSAIAVVGTAPNTIIRNCNFVNNYADYRGGISGVNYTAGGAIVVDGVDNVQIRNCYFSGNTALNRGGAIVIRNDAQNIMVIGCTFVNNQAPDGGAIYNQQVGGTIISGCTFTNNKATTGIGGAIYSISSISIVSSTFNRNSAKNNGGGIYIAGSGISTISRSKFTNNNAKNGGGVYNNALLSISSTSFNSNKANNNGGAIYADRNLNITRGSIKNNTANYGSGIYNLATLRISNVAISSNSARIIGIILKAPVAVKPYKKFTITTYLMTGDNINGAIYNKKGSTYINSKIKTALAGTPGKSLIITIAGKKKSTKSGSNGIVTMVHTASKSNIAVKTSYTWSNKIWSKSASVKINSSAKSTVKTYINKKSTNKKSTTKKNPTSTTTTSKGGSSVRFSLVNHETAHLASLVNMDNYKIDSKKYSYWNLKKNPSFTAVTDYLYKVDKFGWYSGSENSKGSVTWKKITGKPSTAGTWFNLSFVSNKYTIGNIVPKFTNNTSDNSKLFFVSAKTTINHGLLTPYTGYTYTLVNKKTGSKTTKRFFEKATTDIYFKHTLTAKELDKYSMFLKKTWRCDVNHPEIKKHVITLLSKVEGELTPKKKALAVYKWLRSRDNYDFYELSRRSSVETLRLLLKRGPGVNVANCVDQAHLTIALYRTMGIPAVYERGECRLRTGRTIGHWWSEVYCGGSWWYLSDTTGAKIISFTHWWVEGNNDRSKSVNVPSKIVKEIRNSKRLA